MKMTKQELIDKLRDLAIALRHKPEEARRRAEEALLSYINDAEVRDAFEGVIG
jgi:hypothetical protein